MIFIVHKCSKITLRCSPVLYIFSSLQRKKLGFAHANLSCLCIVFGIDLISAVISELSHKINKLVQKTNKQKKSSVFLAGINSI